MIDACARGRTRTRALGNGNDRPTKQHTCKQLRHEVDHASKRDLQQAARSGLTIDEYLTVGRYVCIQICIHTDLYPDLYPDPCI